MTCYGNRKRAADEGVPLLAGTRVAKMDGARATDDDVTVPGPRQAVRSRSWPGRTGQRNAVSAAALLAADDFSRSPACERRCLHRKSASYTGKQWHTSWPSAVSTAAQPLRRVRSRCRLDQLPVRPSHAPLAPHQLHCACHEHHASHMICHEQLICHVLHMPRVPLCQTYSK